MQQWDDILPRSLFSLLGNGRSPELYSVYLDTLVILRQRAYGSGLHYEDARDIADKILAEHGIYQVIEDKEFDDASITPELSSSFGPVILHRLRKAGWIRRETDKMGNDVIRLPIYAFKLIPAFAQVKEEQTIEYDALLLSIFSLLSQEGDIPRRQAINRAYQQMVELMDNVRGLLQHIASLKPSAAHLSTDTISDWIQRYLDDETKGHYTNLKLRNSPDKWYTKIVTKAIDLRKDIEEIAITSLNISSNNSLQPSNENIQRAIKDISTQLYYIQERMKDLSSIIKELDMIVIDIERTYSRRVSLLTSNAETRLLIENSLQLIELLRDLPKKSKAPLIDELYFTLPHLQTINPRSVDWRQRDYSSRTTSKEDLADWDYNTTLPDELKSMMLKSSPGPKAIERWFRDIFGDKQTMQVVDLLGQTKEDAQKLVRLINYCGLVSDFGFTVEVESNQEMFLSIPLVENEFLRVSNVTIRKR